MSVEIMDPARVVLRRREAYKAISVALRIQGIALFLAGILLIASEPAGSVGQAVTGFGLFFWGISYAIRRNAENEPSRLEFDNKAGALRIFQKVKKTEIQGAELAYGKIAQFLTVPIYDEGSKTYATTLAFKNGARWVIRSSRREDTARQLTMQLTTAVDLRRDAPVSSPVLPTAVKVERSAVTVFSWPFDFLSLPMLPPYLAVAGFLWAMLAIVAANDVIGTMAVGAFTALVAGVFIYFGLRWVGARGFLEIGPDQIRYFEKRGFSRKMRHSIKTADLSHVICGSPVGSGIAILLVNHDEWVQLQKIGNGEVDLSEILDALSLVRRVFKIYTPTLNFSEQVRFAAAIEEAVAAKK